MKTKITLLTLLAATLQDIFDQAVDHLRTQNSIAMEGDMCMYRTPDGKKCAAGAFISDEEYERSMEGKQILAEGFWAIVLKKFPYVAGIPKGYNSENEATDKVPTNLKLLRALQTVHDHFVVARWEKELRDVAERFNIVYTPPNNK
jgi:hypothetical protein